MNTNLCESKSSKTAPDTASLDDTFNLCSNRIRGTSFDCRDFTGVNDYYKLLTEVDVRGEESSGWSSHLTNGRGVYRAIESPDKCIWWHALYRHWWLGYCSQRGSNHGCAYLQPDKTCPQDGSEGDWRWAGSDGLLKKAKVIEGMSINGAIKVHLKLLYFIFLPKS